MRQKLTSRHRALLARRRAQTASSWYRIKNEDKLKRNATVYIYDEIGYFGVSASDFVQEFNKLDVGNITLHINSPGGDVWDGIAIYNAIKNHKARVTARIDGIAASAASFIAMAGDEIVIERNAQVMIHEAHGMAIGNAEDMREMAELLDKSSDNIADIYSRRSKQDVEKMREAMRAETWYSAQEAVTAGLADRVADAEDDDDADQDEDGGDGAPTNPVDPDTGEEPTPRPDQDEPDEEDTPMENIADFDAIIAALKGAFK